MVMGRQSQFAEGELSRAQDQSDSAWGHIDFSGKKMRDEVIEGLKEFQSKTGHNE
jgi:hypothetical protein